MSERVLRYFYTLKEKRSIVTEAYSQPHKVQSTARKYKVQPRQIRAWQVTVDKALLSNISDTSDNSDLDDSSNSSFSVESTTNKTATDGSATNGGATNGSVTDGECTAGS